ncbi:DNA-binding protein [archaeon]|nr:DNA-binding protein [archaeon]
MVKISDITVDSKDVEVEASVVEVGEPRTVNTRFGPKRVATAIIEDDTGRINLSLWEDQIDTVSAAKKLKIAGAYVTEWSNNMQINLSKQATLEVVE